MLNIPGENMINMKVFSSHDKAMTFKREIYAKLLAQDSTRYEISTGIMLSDGGVARVDIYEHEVI